jgi:hypothetical protein
MTPTEARRRFPARLRSALEARGMKQYELADLMGLRVATVSEWCRGTRFPAYGQADGLVEHLQREEMAVLLTAAHTIACVVCGRGFVQTDKGRKARYCGGACKSTHWDRKRRNSKANDGVVAKHRLTMYQDAVDAFCRQCSGLECMDADCSLQVAGVSPLPVRAA